VLESALIKFAVGRNLVTLKKSHLAAKVLRLVAVTNSKVRGRLKATSRDTAFGQGSQSS